jgi:hypothetical protein
MNQTEPKFIGKRMSVIKSKEEIKIEISQQVERWQEALLIAWLLAWTMCGGVFVYYTFGSGDFMQRIFFAVVTAMWLFFFVRIAKVFFWRKMGKEVITVRKGELTLQNAFGKRGRVETFHFHNIFKLGLVKHEPTNFFNFLDNSFWIIGGDRVGFSYGSQKIRLGKQLATRDAEMLVRIIESGMREFKS